MGERIRLFKTLKTSSAVDILIHVQYGRDGIYQPSKESHVRGCKVTADFDSSCRKDGLLLCFESGNRSKNESRRLILSWFRENKI
jgi:hypothetical protein